MNSNGAPRNLRILVVDDDIAVGKAIGLMLEFLNQHVEFANDAQECLRLIDKSNFDLVFTDYDMPGMKGDELAATIKRLNPRLPVVMVTAYVDILPPVPGVDAMIAKPFQLKHLRDAIDRLVPQPTARDPQPQNRAESS